MKMRRVYSVAVLDRISAKGYHSVPSQDLRSSGIRLTSKV